MAPKCMQCEYNNKQYAYVQV